MRCAACTHSWFVQPELSLEQEINASDLSREKVERMRKAQGGDEEIAPHLAYREKEIARRRSGSRMAVIGAWTGTAAVFFALGAAAVVMRDDVVKVFPKASSAYAMAGLDVNRFGLELADLSAERLFDGTTPVLTVSGSIFNVTNKAQLVPNVRVDLRDDAGRDVESILITPDETRIGPGEEVRFNSRLDSPSLDAYDLSVTFVERSDQIRLVSPVTEETSHSPAEADPHGEYDSHEPDEAIVSDATDNHDPEDPHPPENEHPPEHS